MLKASSVLGLLVLAACGGSKKATPDGAGGSAGADAAGTAGSSGAPGDAGAIDVAGTMGGGGTGVVGGGGTGVAGVGVAGASGGAGSGASGGTSGAAGTGVSGTGGTNPDDGGADGRPDRGDAGPFYPLDMNDVTILAPLPTSDTTPVLLRGTDLADDGTSLVPRALYDRLTRPVEPFVDPILRPLVHGLLHLVAVRFDLCDRPLPGECPESEDGRMRLVFQPIFPDGGAQDAGFHAFYAIRNDEIAGAVAALRELAMAAPPQNGALRVSPALAAANPGPYATRLRAFVKRYGGEARLVRLTVNAQPEIFSQVRWELRGVEKKGGAFADIPIVGSTAISESVIFSGDPGYDVTPVTDTPPGLLGAIAQRTFEAADTTRRREYLAALAAVDNPMSHTAETVACVACHVSTVVTNMRAAWSVIDPLTLPGRYTSKFDLSISGGTSATNRATRALGYLGRQPMISQRVVNDTAQTLKELEQRYPPP